MATLDDTLFTEASLSYTHEEYGAFELSGVFFWVAALCLLWLII